MYNLLRYPSCTALVPTTLLIRAYGRPVCTSNCNNIVLPKAVFINVEFISPHLNIENPFVISFIFVLLIFSNIWSYLNNIIINGINNLFPSMKFYRPAKNRIHWLMQAIVGGIAVAVTLYFLTFLLSYIGEILGTYINKDT